MSNRQRTIDIQQRNDHICGRFHAMASPCEILVEGHDVAAATPLLEHAAAETWRIQDKFSRYTKDSVTTTINQHAGQAVNIDAETYRLLQFADTCYQLSEGLFDITSGVLRKVWHFDGSSNIPDDQDIQKLLPFIGWERVKISPAQIHLPASFELDFGGIGKEYAVDNVANMFSQALPEQSVLVNFGGDLQVTRPRRNKAPWHVGIENPHAVNQSQQLLQIRAGGLATSGDTNRFLMHNGQRLSHILNPKTGYPIRNAPRSVTVAAQFCVQAGMLSTMALLHGSEAEAFLNQQDIKYWCHR